MTDVPTILGSFPTIDHILRRQGEARNVKPVATQARRTTTFGAPARPDDTGLAQHEASQRKFSAPLASAVINREINANSAPLQIWEGTVVEVDLATRVMQVLLDAKIGQMPRHTAEIELEWVAEQDRDLVRPGAVFYLILFKRTNPSVENAQELRFRRRPAWTAAQIEQIGREAVILGSKMKALPTAE